MENKHGWEVQFVFHLYLYLESLNYISAVQPSGLWLNTTI